MCAFSEWACSVFSHLQHSLAHGQAEIFEQNGIHGASKRTTSAARAHQAWMVRVSARLRAYERAVAEDMTSSGRA
jgi:hypothetical protein